MTTNKQVILAMLSKQEIVLTDEQLMAIIVAIDSVACDCEMNMQKLCDDALEWEAPPHLQAL